MLPGSSCAAEMCREPASAEPPSTGSRREGSFPYGSGCRKAVGWIEAEVEKWLL